MHADRCGRTVIDIQAGVQCFEAKLRAVAGRGKARCSATTRPGDGVQINVVWHFRIRVIVQMKLHRIALTHADKTTGNRAAKRPEGIFHAL